MLRTTSAFVVIGLLLSGAVAMSQNPDRVAEGSTGSFPPSVAKVEITLDNLLHEIDLWYDAVLDGNGKDMDRHESGILQIVRDDLDGSQATVQFCAKQAALAGELTGVSMEAVSGAGVDARSAEFRRSLSILRSKEQKSRAFIETETSSNKYRLISDYVDILRKQLGMPKLKLASKLSGSARFPGARIVK